MKKLFSFSVFLVFSDTVFGFGLVPIFVGDFNGVYFSCEDGTVVCFGCAARKTVGANNLG